MIRSKQVTCEEVIQTYVSHATQVNNVLNAIVEDRFEQALQEARDIDKFIASNVKTEEEICKDTPLLGIPITVKESLMLKGLSSNAGRVQPKKIAHSDAEVVRIMRNAGAIPILVSNTPELCLFWETFNNVTGKTLNPYDTRRTVGGSSGGEAALIGSGASIIGLGTDIAGSLRLPASFTGIFSHKPTAKIISNEGSIPTCLDERVDDYFVVGPLTRYAEDLPLVMQLITKPELKNELKLHETVPLKNIKFFYMEKEFESALASNVDKDITEAMSAFVDYLKRTHGIVTQKVTIKEMWYSHAIAAQLLLNLDKIDCQFYDENMEFKLLPELFRFVTFRSKTTLPIILYGVFKMFYELFLRKSFPDILQANENLKKVFKDLLGDNGVLLYPTFTGPAHYHFSMFYKALDFSYLGIFNALGLPVSNCPAGFNSEGLPIGFQVIANAKNDRLTLAVAQEINTLFGGWKSPSDK
ncbi:uncharacterized protein CBL_04820 [Carabus blaptoides fortunei]